MNGGYNFKITLIELQPSAVMRIMADNLLQIDGNLKLTLKNAYSIGISYRNKDAFIYGRN